MRVWALGRRAVELFNSRQKWIEIQVHRKAVPPVEKDAHDTTPDPPPAGGMRELVARLYIAGEGIEIGALNGPLGLPMGTRVQYVDRLEMSELREHYPGLDIAQVDIVDDGECLVTIPESSQDFIVANHLLEHCEDPIQTLHTFASRLKPGGVLFMAVPDADFTFDCTRPSTTFAHLLEDHTLGPARSRMEHYREWVNLVKGYAGTAADEQVGALIEMGYRIHYHVWRMHELLEFLARSIDELDLRLSLELAMRHGLEVICVLRRPAISSAGCRGS